MEGEGKQPFAGFVSERLVRASTEIGQWWAEHAQLLVPQRTGESSGDGRGRTPGEAGEQLVRMLATVLADDSDDPDDDPDDSLVRAGAALGATAHQHGVSLHRLLEALDLLTAVLLRAAERAARDHGGATAGEGLAVARRIAGSVALLRLGATAGYTQAAEDELRDRFRTIRHNLRNPLGTLKSAVALLTDESMPAEARQGSRVRAMVARNARSLDQMISEALGDEAARLPVFRAPAADAPAERSASVERPTSGREQGDDISRGRQRPDLESGAL